MRKFNLEKFFGTKNPIIGMIHLAGSGSGILARAAYEIGVYSVNGLDGIIVEDYHGGVRDVLNCLKMIKHNRKMLRGMKLGLNLLSAPDDSLRIADFYGIDFVQFDNVNFPALNPPIRSVYSEIPVLGGVRFKHQPPTGKSLELDINEGLQRCEVIVTTGDGTGIETPLSKLREFRSHLGERYLFSGAGLNADNVEEQLGVVDGAIVGSYFKAPSRNSSHSNTQYPVNPERVREIISSRNSFLKKMRR